MLAIHSATGLEMFRPPIVRIHELSLEPAAPRLPCAPALSFPQHITVQQAIEALRQMPPESDSIYYLFVTDYEERLVGVVSLRQLVVAPPGSHLFELMDRRVITLPDDASLEEQAHVMSQTRMLALPMVDDEGRLVGAVDTHDMVAAIKDEATETMYRLATLSASEDHERPLFASARERILGLVLHLFGMVVAGWMISTFSHTLAHMVTLAVVLPIVSGQGRVAGTQTLTLVVRSLALGKVRIAKVRQVLNHELSIGLVNGLGVGLLVSIGMWLWQGNGIPGLVAGVATAATLWVAAGAGVLVPTLFKAVRLDPARWSLAVVSTIVYGCSMLFFLGLSTLAWHAGYL
ncbi:MAG: magnesium transporter [Chloroflexaceae bacterium]|nr:magnesium transporter [Chloroflexaceae bacterium]